MIRDKTGIHTFFGDRHENFGTFGDFGNNIAISTCGNFSVYRQLCRRCRCSTVCVDLSNVTLRSYSYAGGTMADGTVVSAGGFDPILAIFDSTGLKLNEYDDGPDSVPSDPLTGLSYDSNLVTNSLAAGTYTATIAQYANFSAGSNLSDGFTQSSSTFTSTYNCSNGQFCDAGGNNHCNFWAFDVLGVETAVVIDSNVSPVPLPAGLPMILTGLGALAIARRRRKS